MQFEVTDTNGIRKGMLKEIKSLDVDLADKMEFTWQIRYNSYNPEIHTYNCLIYAPNTEFGGMIGAVNPITATGVIKLTGWTWRGLIDKEVVEPPIGEDYRIVSGEANEVVGNLFAGKYGSLIQVSTDNSGFTVNNHKINRDIHMLEALSNMLTPLGAKISIKFIHGQANGVGHVLVKVVPIKDLTNSKEFSADGRLNYNIEDYRMGINKLICLGKGDLKERLRVYLYVGPNGQIQRTQYFTGLDCHCDVYDNSSAEDEAKLIEGGTKRLKELMDYQKFKVYIPDDSRYDIDIGDIVGGRDRLTNTLIQKPVINKIYKRQGYTEKITYTLEGED